MTPVPYPDGTLLREHSRPTVWLVVRGVLYGVPSLPHFYANGYTWDRVRIVADDSLADADTYPPNGTVVQEMTGGTFVVYSGVRFTLANTDFGPRGDFSQSQISVVVPTGFLGLIPEGGPYRRRLRQRFLGRFWIWLRRQERSRRAQLIASNLASLLVGGVLGNAIWAYITR